MTTNDRLEQELTAWFIDTGDADGHRRRGRHPPADRWHAPATSLDLHRKVDPDACNHARPAVDAFAPVADHRAAGLAPAPDRGRMGLLGRQPAARSGTIRRGDEWPHRLQPGRRHRDSRPGHTGRARSSSLDRRATRSHRSPPMGPRSCSNGLGWDGACFGWSSAPVASLGACSSNPTRAFSDSSGRPTARRSSTRMATWWSSTRMAAAATAWTSGPSGPKAFPCCARRTATRSCSWARAVDR